MTFWKSAQLRSTMSFVRVFSCLAVGLLLHAPAYAKAHCFCKLQSLSTIVTNFGEIATYNTQSGHDGNCSALCNDRAKHYVESNRTSACNTSHGGTLVAFYAVGTKSYQSGENYACPQTGASVTPGSIAFGPHEVDRMIKLNGKAYDTLARNMTLPPQDKYGTFEFSDRLPSHLKEWTYSAKLYRDNVLMQELSATSHRGDWDVIVTFTSQPAGAVHHHTWKIAWYYFAPGANNGSAEFWVP
jgi:hypothetical protein